MSKKRRNYSLGVPKVITDGTHAPPISVKIVGEPHSFDIGISKI
jgi:hypothetical protein